MFDKTCHFLFGICWLSEFFSKNIKSYSFQKHKLYIVDLQSPICGCNCIHAFLDENWTLLSIHSSNTTPKCVWNLQKLTFRFRQSARPLEIYFFFNDRWFKFNIVIKDTGRQPVLRSVSTWTLTKFHLLDRRKWVALFSKKPPRAIWKGLLWNLGERVQLSSVLMRMVS